MGRPPKFKPAERARILALARREGNAAALRAHKNLSPRMLQKWLAADKPTPPADFEEPALNGSALKKTSASAGGYPFAGEPAPERSPAADAARAATGATSPEEHDGEPLEHAVPAAAPGLTPDAVVELAQMLISMAGHVAVASAGVEFTDDHERLLTFTPAERGALLATAPSVTHYLDRWLSDAPLVGAFTFAGTLIICGATKLSTVNQKAEAQAAREAQREQRTADAAAAAPPPQPARATPPPVHSPFPPRT